MNSIHEGRVTKRCSYDKCVTLERANFILQNQLEQMRFKLFILDEQKRQYEEYSTYLEETLSTYKDEEKIFEETSLNFTDCRNETEEKGKKNEKDETVASVLIEKNQPYWRCFFCLIAHGEKGGHLYGYSTHLLKCHGKRFVEDCYQNESMKCNACHGVQVVFQQCLNASSNPSASCNVCNRKHRYNKDHEKTFRKHVETHQKLFSFICSCTDNFVFKL